MRYRFCRPVTRSVRRTFPSFEIDGRHLLVVGVDIEFRSEHLDRHVVGLDREGCRSIVRHLEESLAAHQPHLAATACEAFGIAQLAARIERHGRTVGQQHPQMLARRHLHAPHHGFMPPAVQLRKRRQAERDERQAHRREGTCDRPTVAPAYLGVDRVEQFERRHIDSAGLPFGRKRLRDVGVHLPDAFRRKAAGFFRKIFFPYGLFSTLLFRTGIIRRRLPLPLTEKVEFHSSLVFNSRFPASA